MSTRLDIEAHTSPLHVSNQIHHYGASLDVPTRKHAIALTLILVSFISIRLKLSNNQAKLSKQSLTADAAIRIVLLTLQGYTATHTHTSVTAWEWDPSRGYRRGCCHNTSPTAPF